MPGLFKRARCNLDGGDSSIPPQGAQCSWKPNTLLAASPKPQQLLFLSPLFADSFSRQDLPLSDCTSEASDSDCSSGDSENSSQTSTSSCTSIVVPAAESKVTKRWVLYRCIVAVLPFPILPACVFSLAQYSISTPKAFCRDCMWTNHLSHWKLLMSDP